MHTEFFQRDQSALLGVYGKADIEFTHGEGALLWDSHGRQFLDFGSGIAVNALGHNHPAITAAITSQAQKFNHISNLYPNLPQIELAEALLSKLPFDKVFFCNSGTEANEALLKFCRKIWFEQGQTERIEVISFHDSFHGRTLGALSLTGQSKFQEGFGPMPGAVKWLPWNDVAALKQAVSSKTAAILLEPIQAEGGVRSPSAEFIQAIHDARTEFGCLILADEIQCALGRLGTLLGSESVGLKPDLVSLAKPIGGGLPLGAVLLKQEHAQYLRPGDHGTTFGGNPLACAAGLVTWNTIADPEFLQMIQSNASHLHSGLQQLCQKHSAVISELRGQGHLVGLRTHLDLNRLIQVARDNGLIVLRAGSDVLRLLPPLIVSQDQIDTALALLDLTFTTVTQEN